MELLKTEPVRVEGADGPVELVLEEKDHGELVTYDVYRQGRHLMTLAKDGSIIFLNFDADKEDKELFKIPYLNQLMEKMETAF